MSNHSIWDNKFYIWELELTVLSSGKCFRRGWFPCSCVFFFSSIPELVKNEHISAAGYQSLSLVPFSTGEVTFWCSLHDFCQLITELSLITADWTVCLLGWWQWPCPWPSPQVALGFLPFMKHSWDTGRAVAALSFTSLTGTFWGHFVSVPLLHLPSPFSLSLLHTVMFHSKLNCKLRNE